MEVALYEIEECRVVFSQVFSTYIQKRKNEKRKNDKPCPCCCTVITSFSRESVCCPPFGDYRFVTIFSNPDCVASFEPCFSIHLPVIHLLTRFAISFVLSFGFFPDISFDDSHKLTSWIFSFNKCLLF